MEQIVGWTFINPCCPLIFLWVVWTTMQKIASPQDLQAELQRLLAYSQGQNPSREKIASALNGLADRVSAYGDETEQVKDHLKEALKQVQNAQFQINKKKGNGWTKRLREDIDKATAALAKAKKVQLRHARVAARDDALEEAQTALYKAKDETFSQLEAMARAGDEHLRTREYRAHQDIAENLDKALGSVSKAIRLKKVT